MAITIQHNPGSRFSIHGDVIFTVCDIVKASDPVTYPDYRYIADIYIGSTQVARLKAYPQPDNKIGVFNIGNILRSYQAAVFNPTGGVLRSQEMGNGEFSLIATVKFGEEYNFTLYTNITVDIARSYYGHYNGRLIGQLTNLSDYIDEPLTKRITHIAVFSTSQGSTVYNGNKNNFVPYFPSNAFNVTLQIKAFTDAGVELSSNDQVYTPSAGEVLQQFNLSPTIINTIFPGAIDFNVAKYFTVAFLNPNLVLDRTMKFNLVCESRYEVFTLHFLNSLGGFESRDFTKVSRKTIDIEKSEFGKLGYTMDSSGVVSYASTGNVYNETRAVFSSQYKEKLTLNTDILTDDEYNWLADLFLSPMVYVEQSDYYLPCVITANNYEFRKVINDKLTNITIDIEFGEQYNAQYR